MAKKKSESAIEGLLEERRKIEHWLDRLEKAADRTNDDVRTKVRGDYEKRLEKVVAELQGYGDDLRQALEKQQKIFAEYKQKEEGKSEELAEAELRHAVGEFDESTWTGKKAGILEELVNIREGLGDAEEEIEQLEGVLASLEAGPEELEDELDASVPDIGEPGEEGEDEEPVDEPIPEPDEETGRPSQQTEAFGDELEFLKSVTDDEENRPEPGRASGAMQAVQEPEEPQPVNEDGSAGRKEKGPAARSARSSTQRTLKCGECGALNLPTEWYCERCGAELAGL